MKMGCEGSLDEIQPRYSGIPTFMRLPHSRDLDGQVDATVVGIPFDCGGVIRVGACYGPRAIREQSTLHLRRRHRVFGISPADEMRVVDYGDVALVPGSTEMTLGVIERELSAIFSAGVVPIVLGGDHGVTLPTLRGAANRLEKLSVVHFDAHLDVVDTYYDGQVKYNAGTVFRRAVDEGLVEPSRSIQIGANGSIFSGMGREDSEHLGYQVISVEEALELGMEKVSQMIRDRVSNNPAYLSFDVDVMDISVAPGSGAPEVGGFVAREIIQIVRRLSDIHFVGFDIVEVNPLFDAANMTTILAANVAFEFLTLVALYKGARRE